MPPHCHILFAVGLHTENSQGEENGTQMLSGIRKEMVRAHVGNKTRFPMSGTGREKKKKKTESHVGRTPVSVI